MTKPPVVYILASKLNGTLYVGVTSDLINRIWEYQNDTVEGFTSRYQVYKLVWYELHESMESAISREKQLKNWKRQWKLELIEAKNPERLDLCCGNADAGTAVEASGRKPHRLGQELILQLPHAVIYTGCLHQVVMPAAFHDSSAIHNQYLIYLFQVQ